MLWQVNVGGDICLFEMDPVDEGRHGQEDLRTLDFLAARRGLRLRDRHLLRGRSRTRPPSTTSTAPATCSTPPTSAWGSRVSLTTRRTQHLFVAGEFPSPFNVWVVEPAERLRRRSSGFRRDERRSSRAAERSASLEADCDGRLWILDPDTQTVYRIRIRRDRLVRERHPLALRESAVGNGRRAAASLPVAVTFDSAGLLPGLRQGSLLFSTDTPTPVAPGAGRLHGSLQRRAARAASPGTTSTARPAPASCRAARRRPPTFSFCPAEVVTRRSMAGFIERAVHGALTPPPVYLGEFNDVLLGSFNANYIQGLVERPDHGRLQRAPPLLSRRSGDAGADGGLRVEGPARDASRRRRARLRGPSPTCRARAVSRSTTSRASPPRESPRGCGNGDYCPNASITNAQMAVFLVKAFQIPYLP